MSWVHKSIGVIVGSAYVILAACASAPPPPPKPMTHEQYVAFREKLVMRAVRAAYRNGQDGEALYERLELQGCLHDAMALSDKVQRDPAVQQCRVNWPQPVRQVQQTAPTNCDNSAYGQTRCTSQ